MARINVTYSRGGALGIQPHASFHVCAVDDDGAEEEIADDGQVDDFLAMVERVAKQRRDLDSCRRWEMQRSVLVVLNTPAFGDAVPRVVKNLAKKIAAEAKSIVGDCEVVFEVVKRVRR